MPPGKPRIVFLDRATISVPVKAPTWPHEWQNFDAAGPAEVADRIADAEVVIVNKVELRRETIERASRLGLVLIAATGTDNVDTAALDERNIVVRVSRCLVGPEGLIVQKPGMGTRAHSCDRNKEVPTPETMHLQDSRRLVCRTQNSFVLILTFHIGITGFC